MLLKENEIQSLRGWSLAQSFALLFDLAIIASLMEEILWDGDSHILLTANLLVIASIFGASFFKNKKRFEDKSSIGRVVLSIVGLILALTFEVDVLWSHAAVVISLTVAFFELRKNHIYSLLHRPSSPLFITLVVIVCVFISGVFSSERDYFWLKGEEYALIRYPLIWIVGLFFLLLWVAQKRLIAFSSLVASFVVLAGLCAIFFTLSVSYLDLPQTKILSTIGGYGIASAISVLFCRIALSKSNRSADSIIPGTVQCGIFFVGVGLTVALFLWASGRIGELPLALEPERTMRVSKKFLAQLFVSEDPIFMHHHGLDFKRVRDVLRETLIKREYGRGGSTLSMQLAKVRYLSYDKTLLRKIDQVAIALLLELRYSKEDILWNYINSIPFADGVIGITAASIRFFHLEPSALNMEQARQLVLSIPDPIKYNPAMQVMPQSVRFNQYAIAARNRYFGQNINLELNKIEFASQ